MNVTDTGPPDRDQRFARLYEQTYTALLRFVERRVHPSHAEDVVADVFLVAWRRLDDVPPAADEARAWLFGVAHRTLRNERASSGRGGVKGVTTILRDGSRHSVSLEDLTGWTGAHLGTPATGGSARG
ncbi:RNA polymerase sigma factor [Nonomuraea sp. NPDC001831]|uniref:RNA polymerase sigma factor n=1 Tax=Nonomuraea sp. NPDC001831 TaxID=3364340 RepID=UPI0036BE913D